MIKLYMLATVLCISTTAAALEIPSAPIRFPFDGPNCISSAMVTAGLLPGYRYTTDKEFEAFTAAGICASIPFAEQSQPHEGDIGIITAHYPPGSNSPMGGAGGIHADRDHTYQAPQVLHAFTVLNDDRALQKSGFTLESPIEIIPRTAMISFLSRQYCPSYRDCHTQVNYFRCGTLALFLTRFSDPGFAPLLAIERTLSEIESKTGRYNLGQESASYSFITRKLAELDTNVTTATIPPDLRRAHAEDLRHLGNILTVRLRETFAAAYLTTEGAVNPQGRADVRSPRLIWTEAQEGELYNLSVNTIFAIGDLFR